jgi:hypothetical protein
MNEDGYICIKIVFVTLLGAIKLRRIVSERHG